MRMMSELKPLFLYSSDKKVYVPIDESDKKKNSAILLLTRDMNSTMEYMTLPYIHNPNLFTSFYIDRSINAFVNKSSNTIIDPVEEQTLCESMINAYTGNTKFKFASGTSIMDERRIKKVYDKQTVKYYSKILDLSEIPDKLNVVVHPTVADLKKHPPKYIKFMKDNYYSYFENDTIHVISNTVYDPESMRGDYDTYLLTELLYAMMISFNEELNFIPTMAIAYSVSGFNEYLKNNKNNTIEKNEINKFSTDLDKMNEKLRKEVISDYLVNADINVFAKYVIKNNVRALNKLLFEASLSKYERDQLMPSDFGLPDKRKYPLNDESHVKAAIRMFNNCAPDDEKELAEAIIKKMKKFGITNVKIGSKNRFKKYYDKASIIKESVDKYDMVCKICDTLSKDELKRITFYDKYRDSEFIIKRFIARTNDDYPIGFLDVYRFPSKPNIAQIVIAVSPEYRGMGLGKDLVRSLMQSNIPEEFGIDIYYWTAHKDNYASQELAMSNGFIDTETYDSYGRKVYIKKIKDNSENVLAEACTDKQNPFVLLEDDLSNYTNSLRRYVYSERIKNDKEVLLMYKDIKASIPFIKRAYINIALYKNLNLFVDLSYYNNLFIMNNSYKMDRGVDLYFDFINRLINNEGINNFYKKQTIFIPVDNNVWTTTDEYDQDITDYKSSINPISVIIRLIRTKPEALRSALRNKNILFVSKRGYFTVDFNTFSTKDLARFKNNIERLNNLNKKVEDEYDIDSSDKDSSTHKALTMQIVDSMERDANIKINNVSSINSKKDKNDTIKSPHLSIISGPISISGNNIDNNIAIITIDPKGPNGFERLNKTVLSNIASSIDTYCMPK